MGWADVHKAASKLAAHLCSEKQRSDLLGEIFTKQLHSASRGLKGMGWKSRCYLLGVMGEHTFGEDTDVQRTSQLTSEGRHYHVLAF